VALTPDNDTLLAATTPPQKCVAMVMCIPERSINSASGMVKRLFIRKNKRSSVKFV